MTQNTLNNTLKTVILQIGSFLGYFFGQIDGLFITLVIFTQCDYISGVVQAIVNKELSSKVGIRGIFKKILIFIVVGIANLVDVNVLKATVLRTAIISFFMANEGISILENCGRCGLPIPKKLSTILSQLKEESDETN